MARKRPEYIVTYVYEPLPPEEEERRRKKLIEILADIILQHMMKARTPQTEEEASRETSER